MKSDDMVLAGKAGKIRRLKVVLVLVGEGQVGKSEALTSLGDELRGRSRFFYEQKCQADSHDRMMKLRYNRRLIGVCTAGDNERVIDHNLKFVECCNVAILAARVDGKTDMLSYMKSKVKNMKMKVWFGKLEKVDAKTPYSQTLVKVSCVGHFVQTLNCTRTKDLKKTFNEQ